MPKGVVDTKLGVTVVEGAIGVGEYVGVGESEGVGESAVSLSVLIELVFDSVASSGAVMGV